MDQNPSFNVPLIILQLSPECMEENLNPVPDALRKTTGIFDVRYDEASMKIHMRSAIKPYVIVEQVRKWDSRVELIKYVAVPDADSDRKSVPRNRKPTANPNGHEPFEDDYVNHQREGRNHRQPQNNPNGYRKDGDCEDGYGNDPRMSRRNQGSAPNGYEAHGEFEDDNVNDPRKGRRNQENTPNGHESHGEFEDDNVNDPRMDRRHPNGYQEQERNVNRERFGSDQHYSGNHGFQEPRRRNVESEQRYNSPSNHGYQEPRRRNVEPDQRYNSPSNHGYQEPRRRNVNSPSNHGYDQEPRRRNAESDQHCNPSNQGYQEPRRNVESDQHYSPRNHGYEEQRRNVNQGFGYDQNNPSNEPRRNVKREECFTSNQHYHSNDHKGKGYPRGEEYAMHRNRQQRGAFSRDDLRSQSCRFDERSSHQRRSSSHYPNYHQHPQNDHGFGRSSRPFDDQPRYNAPPAESHYPSSQRQASFEDHHDDHNPHHPTMAQPSYDHGHLPQSHDSCPSQGYGAMPYHSGYYMEGDPFGCNIL